MARLAPIALLAFAVTLACGRPAAPTATPASPAATPTPRAAATAPLQPRRQCPHHRHRAQPAHTVRARRDLAHADQTTNRAFQGYQSAWEKVDRFRVEIEYSQDASDRSVPVCWSSAPTGMHLIDLDPGHGSTRTQKSSDRQQDAGSSSVDRWIDSTARREPLRYQQLWNPDSLLHPTRRRRCTSPTSNSHPRRSTAFRATAGRSTVEIPGMGKSDTTAWIAQADRSRDSDQRTAPEGTPPAAALQLRPGLRHPATAMSRALPRLAARRPLLLPRRSARQGSGPLWTR
jgi:hypothetical protein